ncbi:small GTP-binding protein RAB6 [Trypanosoma rangeli SC58]|uniref:Small GTP-binding protein RAB6 n=2 Tax=Trypanosoma rangeli SC58 TaxID=429131 RepID=A0A061J3G5_TRYRA|nr:small GTP-binding protein RAB6 [Trypanosoma rangeli SC58]
MQSGGVKEEEGAVNKTFASRGRQGGSSTGSTSVAVAAPPVTPVVKHKIVLLGDQSVGKTSLVTRFMYDTFDQQYQATIGIDFFSKSIPVDNRTVRLHVWDTAGQERFRSLIPSYIRNSSGTLVVYDITSRASFRSTFKWVDEVRAERGEEVVIFLVGNKSDAQDRRVVSTEEGQKKAGEYNLVFMEVSAKQGTNVKALFRKMAEALPQSDDNENAVSKGSGTNAGGDGGQSVVLGKQRDPFLLSPSRMHEGNQSGAQNNNNGGSGSMGNRQGGCC